MHLFARQQTNNLGDLLDSRPALLKPSLYGIDAHGRPVLNGGRCECGHVFFPLQQFGCEKCGRSGSALTPVALGPAGTLMASAVVHRHADVRRPTPFAVGTIALDHGPVIRTLLLDVHDPRLVPGAKVEALLVPVTTADDAPRLDLRFIAAGAST